MGLDDQGQECDAEEAEQILASREGSGDMDGQTEFLVRWEFGTGKVNDEGLPVDRSWVPAALLEDTSSSMRLIQDFFAQPTGGGMRGIDQEVSIHFHAMKEPQRAVNRKKTKIVSAEASKLWSIYKAPLQLPIGAPKGLKARDFLRAHRSLDQHGDGLVRPADIREMALRLRLRLSVDEAAEMLWEADDDHTGALDVQDLVQLYFRVCTDPTGFEPRRLFNLLEFLLFSAPSESEAKPKADAAPMSAEEKAEARASAYTLEAEEATRLARNRYGGRELVPEVVKAYLERMDIQDLSISFMQFLHSPLALVPPNWVDRVVI